MMRLLLIALLAGCQSPAIEATSKALACTMAPTTLDPWFCEQLQKSGIVNVQCPWDPVTQTYVAGGDYAHPDDDCDDTAAIVAAFGRSNQKATVIFPSGDFESVAPYSTRPYLISSPINITGQALVGTNHSRSDQGTRVKLMDGVSLTSAAGSYAIPLPAGLSYPSYTPGAMFWSISRVQISDISIDANGGADFGLYLYRAHSSVIRDVTVERSRVAGVFGDSAAALSVEHIRTANNENDGIVISGGNSGVMIGSLSQYDARYGIVITLRTGDYHSGGFTIMGGTAEQAGSHGVFVSSTRSAVTLHNLWVEGNGDDGIRTEGAHNVAIRDNRVFGATNGVPNGADDDSVNHAIQLVDCQNCAVTGNQISGASCAAPKNYEDIWIQGDSRYSRIRGNIYHGGTSPTDIIHGNPATCGAVDRFEVVYDDGAAKTRADQHQSGNILVDSPPTTNSNWRVGSRVWNRRPLVGTPFGWMCTATYTTYGGKCLTWKPMGLVP